MNTKKLMLSLVAMLGIGFLGGISANASTWYVRDGGGTPSQCTGTTNAVYPGSGANLPCAINHPAWVIGTPGANGLMAGGDTLYIVGDSDINPGQQAQYMIGYGMPNTVPSQCSTSYAYSCILSPVPAGISSSEMTAIIGIGTHQPQLWGTQGLWNILYLTLGNYDVENLEITDHDSCTNQSMDPKGTVDGFPAYCGGTDGGYPYGPWAASGLQLQGTNIITKNLHVHRLANEDITFPGNVSNWNSTNDVFTSSGGGGALTNGGTMTFGGNNTMNNDTWAFGGCSEHYPTPDPANVLDPANYHHCCDQSCGGYSLGGGFMMQNDGAGACGNWTISNSKFLFNIKTNIDFLHCDGTGTFNLYRSRSEGSSGEAFKAAVNNVNLEEDQLIGNAPVWDTPAFKAITSPYDMNGNPVNSLMVCRGNAVTIFNLQSGSQINYINDDVAGNCTSLVETNEYGSCAGAAINAYNTKFIGGYAYDVTQQQVDLYYNGGNDGNSDGPCGSTVPFKSFNNSIYGVNSYAGVGCNGTNSVCSDPLIFGEQTTPLANLFGPTAYYSGTHLGDLLYLQSSSPLKGAAASGIAYTNGSSKDYNGYPANSSPDIGAVQYGSCVSTGGFCSVDGQCCDGGACSSAEQCGAPQPVVSITNPTSGNTFSSGSNVTVTATAVEKNGTISNVSLYNGVGALLGSSGASPYNYTDTNVTTGSHTYVAMGKDAYGVAVASKPVTVTVTNTPPPPSPPVVAITSPANGSSFAAGSNVTITATASETNGTISNISLYNGAGVLLGSSSTSPYSYVASGLPAGTYSYTAQATDANGVSVTSSRVTITITAPSLPVVAITSPANGSSVTTGSYITITATATEANGTISKVAFYNGSSLLGTSTSPAGGTGSLYKLTWINVPSGNYSLTAIAYDNNNNQTTSAPVAVNVGSLPVISLATNNVSFTVPASIILTATASETNGTISKVAFYNGSSLLGTSTSPAGGTGNSYRLMWVSVPPGSYNLTAIAYDNNNNQATSAAIAVTVYSLPVVSLASNGTSFTTPASIILTATASETNGTISKVAFYNGSSLLGTSTSSPYRLMWVSVPAGNYSLTAIAYDNNNNQTTSGAIAVTVHGPPVVSLTSNNTSFTAPASITLTATASEANGTINKVVFYNGSTLIGTATSPTDSGTAGSFYNFTWNNVAAGTYSLTSVAIDSTGATATSSKVVVTVVPPVVGPTVSIMTPVNNASYTIPAYILLTANASETGGTIAKVDYYNGSSYLGTSTSSPSYRVIWINVPAGTYSLTAKATDSNGVSATSSPVSVSVKF